MFPGADLVQALLLRYADTDGYVTSRAVDGVARLAGLGARQTDALRAWAKVRDTDGGAATDDPCTEETLPGDEEGAPSASEQPEAGAEGRDIAAAVVAALAVLEEDRFRRRPGDSLLKAEAEVGLAVLLRGGAEGMGQEPDAEELNGLPSGDLRIRARDCLVLHNLRLVHSLIRPYLEQGLDYEDLFQVGVLGLMRAARKFDPAMGNKFSTYATWWVRQQITRAIADEGALIRIPVHMHEQMRKVAAAERALAAQGRPASAVDVAVQCDMTVQKVEEIRRLSRRTDSLDRVIGDGATLGDFVGESRALPSVEQGVVNTLLIEDVMAVVDTFSERDARVLVRRLGLDGDEPSTLDELGREFGVTRERIRQVESKALSVFRARLRMAGVISAYEGWDGREVDGDGEQERLAKRRARGKGSAVVGAAGTAAAVEEPRRDEEPQAEPEALSPLTPDEERSSRTEGETAVAEESRGKGAPDALAESAVSAPTPSALTTPPSVPSPPEAAPSSEAPSVASGELQPVQYTADWDKAVHISATFEGGIDWLAGYALLALGHPQLSVILGPSAAADVVRAARERQAPDQQVLAALEVLQRVFDSVKEAGLRPEDFFERQAEALVGVTPRAYLARRPLVNTESRIAVRDALREFVAGMPRHKEPAESSTVTEKSADVSSSSPSEDQPVRQAVVFDGAPSPENEENPTQLRAEADRRLAEMRQAYEAQLARMRHEYQERLTEDRQAADERVAAAEAETQRQLDALEEALLRRVDTALLRQERHLRGQADARLARLTEEHREAQRITAERAKRAAEETLSATRRTSRDEQQVAVVRLRADQAEQRAAEANQRAEEADRRATLAEQRVAETEQRAARAEQRGHEGDRRLRRYREETEARIEALEERLQLAEAELSRRDHALIAARRETAAQVEAAEQRAAQRLAQAEHNAWARITELQQQLAAVQAADTNRTTFRDRWRRT
ncbi:sigma-70 family RNA polymerase sigma factor [Streptomyces canus]|uniref:sigma-70 family RNA polymerase sigma factor n=1 Tax=Streptomyces canus TaxID=58343 RepID=UPI0022517A50|nr:sigma-70 family RNA polymerase sigma factor [Streptomyces canus]MCX4860800.1 sigma-70 family RNA polymerase sigma factor [Streptomyces canus]